MALTERTEEDKIEILASGHIQIRTATVIERDGVEISRSFHRKVVDPTSDMTAERDQVKAIASAVHTPEIKAAFIAAQAEAAL